MYVCVYHTGSMLVREYAPRKGVMPSQASAISPYQRPPSVPFARPNAELAPAIILSVWAAVVPQSPVHYPFKPCSASPSLSYLFYFLSQLRSSLVRWLPHPRTNLSLSVANGSFPSLYHHHHHHHHELTMDGRMSLTSALQTH